MALPAYSVLDNGLYEINRCELMGRIPGTQELFPLGDAESATINVTSQKLSRFRKNARVRTKSIEITTQTDSSLTLVLMQRSEFLAGLSVMGLVKPTAQISKTGETFLIDKVKVGGLYYLGKQDVSSVVLTSAGDPSPEWTAGTHFKIVDQAMGVIEILALPEGVSAAAAVTVTFNCAASAPGLNEAQIATNTEFTVELFIRELSEYAKPRFYHLYECPLTMDGDVALIGGDEFAQWTVTGSALDKGGGLGVGLMRELSE